ncbi:MAG: MMPL family transporter, partial [Pseudomonadota bacterium]
FGEQDSLILVLEFPKPPGEGRLPFIRGIAEELSKLEGIRRVRYRFLDLEDPESASRLLRHFLLGMDNDQLLGIRNIFSPDHVPGAVRRNTNRLFLTGSPYLQSRILDDPLELSQFISESVRKKIGALSLGDMYLLIASPAGTDFLVQMTPTFPSWEIVRGKKLLKDLERVVPESIGRLAASVPGLVKSSDQVKWSLTGKLAFHQESDLIFDQETLWILIFSFCSVVLLLILVYRSLSAGAILMVPILAGIGPNYGLTLLMYDSVNPVVMGAAGVLFGLGTDYGVHLWGRFTDELDGGLSPRDAVISVYQQTGPPVVMGALTSILAFLCLCLSGQPAMAQFGYVGASGLILTLTSTIFLFPALAVLIVEKRRDYCPRMRVRFRTLSGLFQKRPQAIVAVSAVVILISLFFACRVTYEKDLFSVFLARDMESMAVSEEISRKFHSNFSHPTLLCFETDDLETGLLLQRRVDEALRELMKDDRGIASSDSVSYLLAPRDLKERNIEAVSQILLGRNELKAAFENEVRRSLLSDSASQAMIKSLDDTEEILMNLGKPYDRDGESLAGDLERSWYLAQIHGRHRFLTHIRYAETVTDLDEIRALDQKITAVLKSFPIPVHLTGARQVMEEVLSTLVGELFRLGMYVLIAVVVFFFAMFGHPLGVGLSLIPMAGAFCISLGFVGAVGMGLPFSIVGVAPLLFGLGMDNGVHVVMGSLHEGDGSVTSAMERVAHPIIFTSLTNVMGFVSMLTSKLYSLQFLGVAVVVGMIAAVVLTLTTLPALLLLIERRRRDA